MANTVTINNIPSNFSELQDYSIQDDNLITNSTVQSTFDPLQNYISYFIYNLNSKIIYSNEAGFSGWSFIDQQVYLDPQADLERVGYDVGNYNTLYLFLNNEASSSIFNQFYIEDISPDRTELRLNTTQIGNDDVVNGVNSLINKIQTSTLTYFDFYLNFGENQLVIANNILLDNTNPNDPTVLIKFYEPLPINFTLKDECWIVTQVAEPIVYNIDIVEIFESIDENIYLKGPNLNLNVKDQINNSTTYTNYATLSSSSYSTGSTNLQYQINSILAERGVEINVDYSDYNNFIYFSSALTRLENFYYKLQLIEDYQYSSSIASLAGSSVQIVNSKNIWQDKINEIITTFDGYDYFLYYDSGSAAWPKINSTYPYNNVSTTSVAGLTFIQSQSVIAGEYDENNNNALINAIPTYLRNDLANAEYELFIEMLGEMFDNIWIYYQDVTEKWNADNRLQYGVSKDIVADVLRDLGLKIYESSFGSADLYTALLGVTPSGSTFPFPYMTGSLPTPTGFEYINSSIIASNQVVPLEDIEKGTYKRLYHNLPMLLKKKGTTVGIQDLITTYGIPSTILRIAEFGGKDKNESNDWDYWKSKFNYKLDSKINPNISTEWSLNPEWGTPDNVPNTLQFRFKLPTDVIDLTNHSSYLWGSGIYGNAIYGLGGLNGGFSQSIWSLNDGSNVALVLEYTGSGLLSGSYSGSVVDPYYQYANLIFTADGMTSSASVYLPFLNGDWWSVMVSRTGSDYFTLYAANNIYNGDDGSSIGFVDSSSYTDIAGGGYWNNATGSHFSATGFNISVGGKSYGLFTGSYQEIRYYTVGLSSSVFYDYTMNPDSIEGNYLNSSPDQLAFRAPLGGELYKGTVSVHPKVTGSWIPTSSFASDSNFTINSKSKFTPNIDVVYLDQPAAGIKNIVSNKIQIVDMNLPEGNTLSQYRSIQQQSTSSTYTENLAYTEVAFSPQNEINDDIMASLGFFNMGDFIGDPRQRFTQAESYPDLDALRNSYFQKYINNYDLNDYIRLIKFFDNSLFKMIKDFTPARASLASGVVVKQHLLERNKYPQPEVEWARYDYSGSINTAFISGGAGGSVNNLNGLNTNPYYVDNVYGVTQSWQETFIIPSGVVTQTHDSQDEFYNGEFSGSNFVVENGELNEANPTKQVATNLVNYQITGSNNTNPGNGIIYWNVGIPDVAPIAGTQYVDELYINEIDNSGLNIQEALSNLSPGDSITFPIQYELDPVIPGIPVIVNKTITGTITNVSPVGSAVWRIKLAYSTGVMGTDISYDPLNDNFVFDSTSGDIILNPFLNNIANFPNSDYNAIINNATGERLSEWHQQVDYATSQTVPVNFQQIISGTAYPAAIQDSNYTSYQYSGIRYWGSKNTTDNFNIASVSNTLNVQTYQNANIGATTLGAPSIENLTNVGLYFQWAGGTNPELPGKTNFQIKFMFDAQGNVFLPDLSSPYYNDLLNAFPQNSQINVIPYNPLTGNSANVQVQNSIQGTQTVFWPGAYFNSYLTSQSGSISQTNYQTASLRIGNLNGEVSDIFTLAPMSTFAFWATTQSADTLLLSPDLSQTINTNYNSIITNINSLPYIPGQNTVVDYNFYNNASLTYIQLTSTESNPNRAGFDSAVTPITVSPYHYSDSSDSYNYTGSFSPYPDLIRIQDILTDEFIYIEVDHLNAKDETTSKIVLTSPIPSTYIGSEGRVNHFTLLRLTPAPEKLYVNVNKAAGESGPGFILPLYPTSELINNFPNIIKDLSEKNLI